MHTSQIAAMAADAPGSAGRQRVRTTSYFRQTWKALLRTSIAAICAGSIAVNAIAMPAPQNQHGAGNIAMATLTAAAVTMKVFMTKMRDRLMESIRQPPPPSNWLGLGATAYAEQQAAQAALAQWRVDAIGIPAVIGAIRLAYGYNAALSYNTTSRLDILLQRLGPEILNSVMWGFTGAGIIAAKRVLTERYRIRHDVVIYGSVVPLAACIAMGKPFGDWAKNMADKVDRPPTEGPGARKLQQSDLEQTADDFAKAPGPIGAAMRDVFYVAQNLKVDGKTIITPETQHCPKTKVVIPESTDALHISGVMRLAAWVWKRNPRTGREDWVPREPVEFTPAALVEPAVKVVADGDHVWRLGNKETYGFRLFRKKQVAIDDIIRNNPYKLKEIRGQLTDFYPGPTNVWGINSQGTVFACKQPCEEGAWVGVTAPVRAEAIATGPRIATTYNEDTNYQPVQVWIKDRNGAVWFRNESTTTSVSSPANLTYGYYNVPMTADDAWVRMRSDLVPARIKDLLNERDVNAEFLNHNLHSYPPVN